VNKWDYLGLNVLSRPFWRKLTQEEWNEVKGMIMEISSQSKIYLRSIENFNKENASLLNKYWDLKININFSMPQNYNMKPLHGNLRREFLLDEHSNSSLFIQSLNEINFRLQKQKNITSLTYNNFWMSKCLNPLNLTGAAAYTLPSKDIGLIYKNWNLLYYESKRNAIAHEGSHILHSTRDHYYINLFPLCIEDAYRWGSLYE